MFSVGDKIYYPMHGAGVIRKVDEKTIDNLIDRIYLIEIPYKQNLQISIRECDIDRMGYRMLVDEKTLDEVYIYLNNDYFPMPDKWMDRYNQNIRRLKSLDIYDIAYVVKGLAIRSYVRSLSIKELYMLNLAKKILVSEFVLVTGISKKRIDKIIEYSMEERSKKCLKD